MKAKHNALDAFFSFIRTIKRKDLKVLKPIKPYLLNSLKNDLELTIQKKIASDDIEISFGFLCDIVESEPLFFKNEFDQVLDLCVAFRQLDTSPDSTLKILAVEIIQPIIDADNEILKQKPERLQKYFSMIIANMTELEDTVAEEWQNPPDGFNDDLEEDDDQQPIKTGIAFVDELINILGKDEMIAFLSKNLEQLLLDSASWKERQAAIMILSQFGEYISENDNYIKNIINIVAKNARDPNPRVRYACCHLLGQFADDLNVFFQEKFGKEYFAITLPLLKDPVPRVVAHCLASYTNFLDHATKEIIEPYFTEIYNSISHWMVNGSCFVKESSLSAMSALFEGAPELIGDFIHPLMTEGFKILKNANSTAFRFLRGNAIEFTTILCKLAKPADVQQYIDPLIHELTQILITLAANEVSDPQNSYLLSGFERLALKVPSNMERFLPQIFPPLMQLAKTSLAENNKQHTSIAEDTELALMLMNALMTNLSEAMVAYEQQIFEIANLIIDNTENIDIKTSAIDVLALLVKIYRTQPSDKNQQLIRVIVKKIWDVIESESTAEVITDEIYSLQKVMKYSQGAFSTEELFAFYAKCKVLIAASLKRISTLSEEFDEDDDKEQQNNAMEEVADAEETLQLEIANFIGKLFMSHQAKSVPVFNLAVEEMIKPAIANPKTLKFALFLIDDAVEHLGQLIPQPILLQFMQVLEGAVAGHEQQDILQSVVFGFGIIAMQLQTAFQPYFEQKYAIVAKIRDLAIQKEKVNSVIEWRSLKNNCASSHIKMIQAVFPLLNEEQLRSLLNTWLHELPLVDDYKEGQFNLNILINLLNNKPELLIKDNPNNLKKVIDIFSTVYHQPKISLPALDQGMATLVKSYLANEAVKNVLIALPFDETSKKFLNKLNEA